MKKLVAAGLVVIMAVGMTGCGKDITLTKQQNDLIAEYVAGTMLKYSYDNEWKYTKLKIAQNTYVPKSQTATAAQTATASSSPAVPVANSSSKAATETTVSGGNKSNVASENPLTSLPAVLGMSGTTISVKNVSVGDSYPADALAIAVPALTGYKVAAVEFDIKNNSGSAVVLNTTSSTVNMKLNVNGSAVTQSTSILKNDINRLKDISLAVGESYTAVAIFQVRENLASEVSGASLTINDGSTSLGTVTVK